MPTYPANLPISLDGASVDRETDRKNERASNGALRARVFFTSAKRKFSFNHPALDATQQSTFFSFYNTNLANSFSFTWPADGVTYTCVFENEPKEKPIGGRLLTVEVGLLEV